MQILLHSDSNTDGSQAMTEHFKTAVHGAMERFGERVTRVEAHLSDVNGQTKSSEDDVHCTLEARLIGLDAIVVKHRAGNAHQAMDGAVRKLKRAVDSQIAKHDTRGHHARAATTEQLSAADAETSNDGMQGP